MKYLLSLLMLFTIATHADARTRHPVIADPNCNILWPCEGVAPSVRGEYISRAMHGFGSAQKVYTQERTVEHPAGCPSRAFCGCGAAVRIFGRPVRSLWLAANWFRFPRAAPAPGMAAVRKHHVFIIEAVLDRGLVLAYDANSGHHQTRVHARSIAGYTIVNPRT